jgi:hypothetical protein
MDVIGFLSLYIGTVQLRDSLGNSCACICSEAGFSSQNGDRACVCTTEEQRSVVRFFLWAKGLNTKDIYKEMFPLYGWKDLSRKAV